MSEQDDSPKKAMSFKDRIAMFNQPKAAAPAPGPPPRAAKPRAFKWKTSGETDEGSSKTVAVAEVPPPAPTPTPASGQSGPAEPASDEPAASTDKPAPPKRTPSTSSSSGAPLEAAPSKASAISAEDSVKHKGFSAEDAKQTAGSLKERIALLSGLKVDKPDAPGRAPKPWRKKTQDPIEGEVLHKDNDDNVTHSTEASTASTSLPERPPAAEAGETRIAQDDPDAPAIQPLPPSGDGSEGAVRANEIDAPTTETQGIALPAMPTRARGPQRKGRSGGAAPAATSKAQSPAAEGPGISAPAVGASPEAVPSVTEIGSPAAGPEDLGNPMSAAELRQVEGNANDLGIAKEQDSAINAGEDLPLRSPPKRASTALIAQNVPLPPSTAESAVDQPNQAVKKTQQGHNEAEMMRSQQKEDVDTLSDRMSKQTLNTEDAAHATVAPAVSPVTRPPAPPALNTQVSMFSPSPAAIPIDTASPTSASTNRRSTARPPVPSAYSQESTPLSGSPRASFDARSLRGSIAESDRGSLVMSPTHPEVVSAEPESVSEYRELADSTVDNRAKETLPSPISKPFDAERGTDMGGVKSPDEAKVMPDAQRRRQSGVSVSSTVEGGLAPVRSSSIASKYSANGPEVELEGGPETNISAMRAYKLAPQEEAGNDNDDEEEEEYQDPEVARRQALAKRMAAMGGMKIGMLPQMPSMVRKKKPQSTEVEPLKHVAAPLLSPPPAPPGTLQEGQVAEEDIPAKPSATSSSGYKPPAGAFVLPVPGRPSVPPPTVLPPSGAQDVDEEDHDGGVEEEDEYYDDEAQPREEGATTVGDDTIMQEPREDEQEVNSLAEPTPIPLSPLSTPPPVPTVRPPPPPPVQSFIETDTDTDGGRSEKRTSMAGSAGMGSLIDFPAPPLGEGHVRTHSVASSDFSPQDQPETLHEEPDTCEDYDNRSEPAGSIPPPRPVRRAPTLDTNESGSIYEGGQAPSRRESLAEPASPSQLVQSYSQRSLPETPVSPTGGGDGQERFGALSPTTSQSSRRSSAMLSSQQGSGPAPTPGLNNEYLAYIAYNSSKTKSRDVDGPLAHTLNDIAYTYRSDPASFGTSVWRMHNSGVKGQSPELEIHGRIDAGCVFLAWDAKFDRGLGRSSLKVGSAEVPHVGIVAEGVKDIKKAKVKVVELVQGRHNVETYKLDDLKSGTVEIRRLL